MLRPAAVLLDTLRTNQVLDQVDAWLPLSRKGGHATRSLFSFAVAFLMSGPTTGIRPFAQALADRGGDLLAGLADVAALPSSASVSRALAGLAHAQVRPFVERLLVSDPGTVAALSNPHLLHRSARGLSWHVLDLDPTITAFRQRTLPEDDDLPEPERLAEGCPGYTGQKRGEVRVRLIPILHAGAGLWLDCQMEQGDRPVERHVESLVRNGKAAVAATPDHRRVVVRADGEFGSVGSLRACQNAGVDVLARLSRYKLLDSEEGVRALGEASWRPVRCSTGAPKREAAELGTFRLKASAGSAAEGEEIEVRVVVARVPCEGKPTHGVVRQGWQLELFATTLSKEEWPAEDLVALYFGRSALECRFAQEDREFGLERTFSFSLPGQEWMVSVGLFLWNTLICRALALNPLTEPVAPQPPRPPDEPAPSSPPIVVEPAPPTPAPATPLPPTPRLRATPTERGLWGLTCDVFKDVGDRPGWTFDHGRRVVHCPASKPLRLATVSLKNRTAALLAKKDDCKECPLRDTCITKKPGRPPNAQPKLIARRASIAVLERIDALLVTRRQEPRRILDAELELPPPPPPIHTPPGPRIVGPLLPTTPLFLPAACRKEARTALANLAFSLEIERILPEPPKRHPYLATSDADRQHQRKTWAARRAPARTAYRIQPKCRFSRDTLNRWGSK